MALSMTGSARTRDIQSFGSPGCGLLLCHRLYRIVPENVALAVEAENAPELMPVPGVVRLSTKLQIARGQKRTERGHTGCIG
jgi:hypothetical protein